MILTIGVSSNINWMEWDEETSELTVSFIDRKNPDSDGVKYKYHNVTMLEVQLLEAVNENLGGSIGKTFNQLIKSQPDTYPYEKIEEEGE